MSVRVVAFALALCAGLLSATAAAQSPSAATLFRRGMAAFGAERYADAADLFERAHALSGEPSMLYNLALAQDRAGEPERALVSYRAFLAASPDAPERAEVEARIAALEPERAVEASVPSEATVDEVPVDEVPVEEAAITSERVGPVLTAPPSPGPNVGAGPIVLLSVGAAGLAAAAVLSFVAADVHGRAEREPVQRTAIALGEEANTLALGANVAWGVAGAVALAGAIWMIVDLTATPDATVAVGLGGAELTLRF